MNASAIRLENVGKRLGAFELGPLNLNVPRGSIYALIGPNGAGKTTTLDLLMGMGQPDLGSVHMLGMPLLDQEVEIKRRTAYVSPELNYQAWGKVKNAINFVRGFYSDWDEEQCDRLLRQFGLSLDEKIVALSLGARIKLNLVLALSRKAELLLLDEPTTGLDAVSKQQFFAELLSFMQREDRTIVISSHQLSDLERFADWVGILSRGKLIVEGRMDELTERFLRVDLRITASEPRLPAGVRLLEREGGRCRLLLDCSKSSLDELNAPGIEIISQSSMTLEELFLALVKE